MMRGYQMAWTDDRVEILKKLWIEGLSASQIANEMGGVTRNAVIGKVHRLGLSGRATPSRPPRPRPKPAPARSRVAAASKPSAGTAPVAPRPEVQVAPIEPKRLPSGEFATVLTLTSKLCKWPIGDPAKPGFKFCGRVSDDKAPYCTEHAAQAYQPQTRRRRKPAPHTNPILEALMKQRREAG